VEVTVEIGTIPFRQSERALWNAGDLAPRWANQFPDLFDAADLDFAINQGTRLGFGFVEWLAAIVLHHATGFCPLFGYEAGTVSEQKAKVPGYPEAIRAKEEIVQAVLPPNVIAAMRDHSKDGVLPPDLLLYAPDFSDWFFCEVKGPGDKVSGSQYEKFKTLVSISGKPVRVLRLRRDD
jgi:hypothetical protein